MKRIVILAVALCCGVMVSAQTLARAGVCEGGAIETFAGSPKSTIAVELRIEEQQFTPGVYARYAQKYLGVRASLAARTETRIAAATVALATAATNGATVEQPAKGESEAALPANRLNNTALSLEQQAAATADLIFSLRKHRIDLITGETGENVFGAGLRAALDEIARLENEYLAMFFGTTVKSERTERFALVPTSDKTDFLLCRYRAGVGVVPIADLAGEAVLLHITPSESIDTAGLPIVDAKAKSKAEYVVANPSLCTLLCGADELAKVTLPIYQYGKRVYLAQGVK